MTISEFQQCIEFNIEHNIRHAILGLGAPGVGKSQVIRQIGKKYGYKVIDIRLAQMSEVEIGGLIYPNETRTKTVWLAPDILPNPERDGDKTILLLDEITSCTKRVQVAAYQLILDRKIGQYTLPEGTFVIALGNREDDDGVYIRLADPLADRFEIHFIEPDFQSWKYDYAIPAGVHPLVVDFLTERPAALHNQQDCGDAMVFSTPRSWDRVSEILKVDADVTHPVIRHKIIGNVGEAVGEQFVEFCKTAKKSISAEDYLAGKAKPGTSPKELSLLTDQLIRMTVFVRDKASADDLTSAQRGTIEAVIRGLFRLPLAEFTMVGLRGVLNMNRVVIKDIYNKLDDDEILNFIHKNRYALGLTDSYTAGMIDGEARKRWLAMWENNKNK